MAVSGRIGVYGATGYTGKLVADELERRGVPYFLAGRDAEKLRALASGLKSRPETLAAGVGDPVGLGRICAGASVLINCAGPFTSFGLPVVAAAVQAGSHYVDSTGEQNFMKTVRDRHHAAALEHKRVILSGAAFEYAMSDLWLPFSVKPFDAVESIEIAYLVRGFGMSVGTLLSAMEAIRSAQWEWEDGRLLESDRRPAARRFHASGGREVRAVRLPGGEILLAPLHVTGVKRVRTYLSGVPGPMVQRLLNPVLRSGFIYRTFIVPAIRRSPEGPSEERRKAAQTTILHEIHGTIAGRPTRRTFAVEAHDIYGLSGWVLAEQAVRLAMGEHRSFGATAPAAVFDVDSFRRAFESQGVTHRPVD